MCDIAVNILNLCKIYKLYKKPSDRLKEAFKLTKKKYYKEHYALNNIDLSIDKGESVGIIGTNGSGKSTLLKIITGVLNATSGEIKVDGRISALLELGAGFNMEYTGSENIYLNGMMMGFTKKEIERRFHAIVEFADIGEFINQPVKMYSSGMFVRLAFAVAINIDPEILIVDEALSVGDVFFQAKCYRKFEEFKKIGKTILFVSHDLNSIAKYCDRVMLLNKGEKYAEGTPKEMIELYKKLLVNSPQVNNQFNNIKNHVNIWKNSFNINPNVIEYGNKSAEIIDFAIADEFDNITNTILKDNICNIKMKVLFHDTIMNPIFAYTVKNLKGTEITGTNTVYENIDIEKGEAGVIKEVIFSQNMILQGGEYLISFGCTGYKKGQLEIYHRLYDACNLIIVSNKNSVGFFDIHSNIVIK